jgi:predicted DNA binding CopG/RHH family protein
MKKSYDFSKAKKNPYAEKLLKQDAEEEKLNKQQITIRLNPIIIDHFKNRSKETNIPYQTLIDYYLLDCALNNKKINIAI